MRVIVFSDSHGNTEGMKRALDTERAELIIHLGDVSRDAKAVAELYNKPLVSMAGNCDILPSVPYVTVTEIDGVYAYICHGHTLFGDERAVARQAKANGCTLALFGHTHVPTDTVIDGVRVINPGSISKPRQESGLKTYAVGDISSLGIKMNIRSI